MVGTGSPVTTSPTNDFKDILRNDVLFPQPLPQSEKYVDFNQQQLNIAGCIHVKLTVEKQAKKRQIW